MSSGHHLQNLLSSAYIIGGSPCSGKSTVAEMLSAQYGLHYYKADDHDAEHIRRADPDQQPVMFKLSKMDWDELWSRAPEELCTDELTYYCECFPFILEALNRLTDEKLLLLEGAAFLPDLIHQHSVRPENVVYMVPTFEFQIKYYSQRPFLHSILKECRDPEQAFEIWMKRDHLFGLEIIRQANQYGYEVMIVDGSADIQEQFESLRKQFRL